MSKRLSHVRAAAGLALLAVAFSVQAAELRVALLQAQEGDARRYRGLIDYLALRGIAVRTVEADSYLAAGRLFERGEVDAMIGGTGVSCAMLIRGVAEPFARPVFANSPGVHAAVVVARKGGTLFDGSAGWFEGKRVAYMPLAASGEFFVRALGPPRAAAILPVNLHAEALALLGRGEADVAVVRDHVWARERSRYPQLEEVGRDEGTNPDQPIVVSSRLEPTVSAALFRALSALEDDASPAGLAARTGMGIRGFVRATARDFHHTITLVRRAGVTPEFAYRF
jgi:ABC-type phosphate/phosphonate transport system substrate-binding protein